jgi:hypothetical protein
MPAHHVLFVGLQVRPGFEVMVIEIQLQVMGLKDWAMVATQSLNAPVYSCAAARTLAVSFQGAGV